MCKTNQLSGFYMEATLAPDGLIIQVKYILGGLINILFHQIVACTIHKKIKAI